LPSPDTAPDLPAVPITRVALVVDDDQSVRGVLRRYLARRGWDVLEAGDAEAALALIAQPNKIDVVVVDLHLPGLSGGALCRRIGTLRPALASRIVMASGDALGAVNALRDESVYCPVVSKPFDLNDFVRVLDEVVAEQHGGD
jgi:DNA-binding NtrC family response regulator